MIALVDDAELPPKFGVHPRQAASHTAAMPALCCASGGASDAQRRISSASSG